MKVKGLRWWVLALIFLAAVLNYVDRQTLSALAPTIQHDLGIDDREYANIVNFFLIAYSLSYLVSGKLADVLGTRIGMSIFVAWWSVSNMLTATAHGMRSMSAYRFSLGLGEAGLWPAASKAVSEWFPPRERALAIGLYTMGATIGATVTPYLVIPLATFSYTKNFPLMAHALGEGAGWRIAFLLTGAIGLVWSVAWFWLYRLPRQSQFIREEELRLIEGAEAKEGQEAAVAGEPSWTWKRVLTFRATWLLLLGRLITDPAWYFYQFWFPKYLHSERGLSQEQLKITWIVYAAAGVGSILGGWLSGRLIQRGSAPAASRMWIMLGCACLMPVSFLISRVEGVNTAMTLTILVVIAALAWLINLSAIVVDVVPKHSVGTVFSVVAAGSTVGGIIMNTLVATLVSGPSAKPGGFLDQTVNTVFGPLLQAVQGKGYELWFLIMAFLYPLAWLTLWLGGVQRAGPSATIKAS